MDSTVSFWEFSLKDLPVDKSVVKEVNTHLLRNKKSKFPEDRFFLITNISPCTTLSPVYQESVNTDGVGSISVVGNGALVAASQNGYLSRWELVFTGT